MKRRLFNTHTCQFEDEENGRCTSETQTRCDVCQRWCCVAHREEARNDLRKKIVLCLNCIPEPGEEDVS